MQQTVIFDNVLAPGVVLGDHCIQITQIAHPIGEQIKADDYRYADRYVLQQVSGWLQKNAQYGRNDEQDTREVLFDVACV